MLPPHALALALALALVGLAHPPSHGRLTWYESVYLPQATMLFGAAALATKSAWRRREPVISPPGSVAIAWALMLAVVIAARSTDHRFALLYVAELAALGTLAASVRRSRCSPATVHTTVVLVIIVLALYAAGEVAGLVPWLSAPGVGPGATLGNRNALARCAAIALPGAAWLASITRGRRRVCWTIAATGLSSVIVLSRCRVAWLACVGALAVAAVLLAHAGRQRIRRRAASTLLGAAVTTAACSWTAGRYLAWSDAEWFSDTAHRLTAITTGSGAVRAEQLAAITRLLWQHPLGIGPAPLSSLGLPAHAGGYNTFASSDVSGLLVALGILPVALGVLGICLGLRATVPWARALRAVPVCATIAAIVICAVGDSTLQLPFPGSVAVISVAAWLPHSSVVTTDRAIRQPTIMRRAGLLVFLLSALIVSSDQVLAALSISYRVRLPRVVPERLRAPDRPSIADLQRRWVRSERASRR